MAPLSLISALDGDGGSTLFALLLDNERDEVDIADQMAFPFALRPKFAYQFLPSPPPCKPWRTVKRARVKVMDFCRCL